VREVRLRICWKKKKKQTRSGHGDKGLKKNKSGLQLGKGAAFLGIKKRKERTGKGREMKQNEGKMPEEDCADGACTIQVKRGNRR